MGISLYLLIAALPMVAFAAPTTEEEIREFDFNKFCKFLSESDNDFSGDIDEVRNCTVNCILSHTEESKAYPFPNDTTCGENMICLDGDCVVNSKPTKPKLKSYFYGGYYPYYGYPYYNRGYYNPYRYWYG